MLNSRLYGSATPPLDGCRYHWDSLRASNYERPRPQNIMPIEPRTPLPLPTDVRKSKGLFSVVSSIRAIAWALSAALSFAVLAATTVPAGATGGPLDNPSSNRQPPYYSVDTGECGEAGGASVKCASPCYPKGNFVYNDSAACAKLLLAGVNQAQAAEGKHTMALPSNYYQLSVTKQLFVLVNLERISHGVPALVGLSAYLSAAATLAAKAGKDPVFSPSYGPVKVWLPPGGGMYGFGGTWAGESVNALAAMFGWMYNDGWGGSQRNTSNFACTSAHSNGCWGHRDELLGEFTGTTCSNCIAGTGYASPSTNGFHESYTVLLVKPVSSTPLNFTWKGELKYLPAGWERSLSS